MFSDLSRTGHSTPRPTPLVLCFLLYITSVHYHAWLRWKALIWAIKSKNYNHENTGSGLSYSGRNGKWNGGLWNRWEVLAMSINQSQLRMRLHPILLNSRFHQKPAASPVFSGCSVLASLRRVLQVTREACSTPEPRICAESSSSFGFLSPFSHSQKQPLTNIRISAGSSRMKSTK
jgi:hypothetical protein